MENVLLVARLVLAGVFLVSGVAKLLDQRGTRQAVIDFGLSTYLSAPLAILLPLVELGIVVALLVSDWAWWGALAALALLLMFLAGIALALVRGRTPDCHCFGQLSAGPIGWSTLGRNTLLAGVAGLIVVGGVGDPGPSLMAWLGDRSTFERLAVVVALLGGLLVAVLGWLILQLLRQNGRILARLDQLEAILGTGDDSVSSGPAHSPGGLPRGSVAPSFSLSSLSGEVLTLDVLRARGKPVVLLFSDPSCGPCNALLPDIARWQRDLANQVTLIIISRGSVDANRAKLHAADATMVLLQHDREVASAYAVTGTPSAVVVQPDGTIGSPLAEGVDAIRQLMTRMADTRPTIPLRQVRSPNGHHATHANGVAASVAPSRPAGLPVGQTAPALRLPDLDGQLVDLADYHGRDTLILFWNPSCGFCQRMEGDVRDWDTNRSDDGLELLVVSTGPVEANRQLRLRSTVVLDDGFTMGRAFAVAGTPSAVLVDAAGRIASPLAVGASAILSLARS